MLARRTVLVVLTEDAPPRGEATPWAGASRPHANYQTRAATPTSIAVLRTQKIQYFTTFVPPSHAAGTPQSIKSAPGFAPVFTHARTHSLYNGSKRGAKNNEAI